MFSRLFSSTLKRLHASTMQFIKTLTVRMRYLLLSALLFAATLGLTCTGDQVYVKMVKKCASTYANEESFKILSGSTVLKTSPSFSNSETRTIEYCLTASANSQYTLKLIDSYGDSWTSGSWLAAYGLYGNAVFKNYLTASREESYTLSLYYAIKKGESWKMLAGPATIDPSWNTLNFSDGSWQQVTLGSAPATTGGTQYFRKTFTGIADMAAYELQMKYRYGIIAYVNGKEVFREYMPDGAVTPSTASSGSYTTLGFHGVLRPSGEFTTSTNILAVELHFASVQTDVDFDAYIAMIASSTTEGKCFIYADSVTPSSSSIFDFTKFGGYSASSSTLPKTVTYAFKGPRPYINAVRIWPYSAPERAPATFNWEGQLTATSAWTTVLGVTKGQYRVNTYAVFQGYFSANVYSAYRINLIAPVDSTTLYIYEAQPMVCADVVPTGVHFKETSYSFYANYEEASISPLEVDMSSCTVSPALPAGMSINAATCVISGIPTTVQPATSYTVQSVVNGQTFTGTVMIEVKGCSGVVAKMVRTYKSGATNEFFSVKDAATQQDVLTVTTGQSPSETITYVVCLTGTKYVVTTSSTSNYWASNSFLYVRLMLSGTEYDTAARIRYDANLSLNPIHTFNGQFSIAAHQNWQYKMGQVPANWQTEAGWQTASMGSFPASTNQIQLYKQTFNVASLDDVAGFVVSLRYIYGCIIYMNNVEVFRNGVTGDLSASSTSTHAYTDLLYHQISLPVKTMAIGDTPSASYLQQGTNTIAIAIVAQTASQTNSVFDCAVRLMGASEVSRIFDFTYTYSTIGGSPSAFGNLYYSNTISNSNCNANHWTMTFDNDRREWISSLNVMLHYTQNVEQVTQFVVKARNTNLEEWTTLKTVSGLAWSLLGQQKKVWLENNKPYNQYRIENFGSGDSANCKWKLGNMDFLADAIPATVPDLSYTSTISLYKDIEMGEVYANSNYLTNFSVQPALPNGVKLDPHTGNFCGTASAEAAAQSYTVTATKLSGGATTAVVSLSVSICTGGQSLITLVARSDAYPAQCSYKLYSGKGTTGEVVASVTSLRGANSLNYGDFCLPHQIYTLELLDSSSNGWNNPAGYYLTVDQGEMIFETGQVPSGVPSVSTMFSSLLPFQIEYDTWTLLNTGSAAPSNWKDIDFDDSQWERKKAALFGEHMGTTAYIRYEVNIPSIDDYHVLNVRMQYVGGVAVYFNGRIVARFNLPDSFSYDTTGIEAHDASVFSKFHIILPTSGAVTGKNIFAVEIHRSTQSALVFDATGVFGVNECSVVVDTFPVIDGTSVSSTTYAGLMDLNPVTYGYQSNTVGSHLHWTVENLEGSKFNSFGMQTVYKRTSYGFSVYVRFNEEDEYTSALALLNQETKERDRSTWPIPLAIAGFREFKFQVDDTASSIVYVSSYVMEYCQRSGANICPGVGDFPSVSEGEISPSACEDGFRGYAYRQCTNGVLGEIQTDKCEYKMPDHLAYPKTLYTFIIDLDLKTDEPTYVNRITEFYMQEDTPLPTGLSIDPKTGIISGKTTSVFDTMSFTVRGKNPKGETITVINIASRKGYCRPDGVFERTEVGKVAEYDCAMKGSYTGSQKRACILGKEDGEWQKATGFCMPVVLIVLLVIIVIVIVVVVVMILMRSLRKAKSVGGVKGKSTKSSGKKNVKKTTSKSVKV